MIEIELNKRLEEILKSDDFAFRMKRKQRRRLQRIAGIRKDDYLLQVINIVGYSANIGYIDRNFGGKTLLHSGKYIKYPRNSKQQRWMKRETSKIYRKQLALPHKGNHYRRLFDYWWTLD